MAKQKQLQWQCVPVKDVPDGSIVREFIRGKLEAFGLKCSRTENSVAHHYVIRFGSKFTTVEHVGDSRQCFDFGSQVEFEILNETQPNFGANPPNGSLVLIENQLLVVATKGSFGQRLFSIADGGEYAGEVLDQFPHFPEWRLRKVAPIEKDIEVSELMRARSASP